MPDTDQHSPQEAKAEAASKDQEIQSALKAERLENTLKENNAVFTNVITLAGEDYACGLTWINKEEDQPSFRELLESGRSLGALSYTRHNNQVGYVSDIGDLPAQQGGQIDIGLIGLVPTAPMVVDYFNDKRGSLLVLLAGERGSFQMIQINEGVLLPNGDDHFNDIASALESFKAKLTNDWNNVFISDSALKQFEKRADFKDVLPPTFANTSIEFFSLNDFVLQETVYPRSKIKKMPFKSIRLNNYSLWAGLAAGAILLSGGLYLTTEVIIPSLFPEPKPIIVTSKPLITPTTTFVDPSSLLEACFEGLQNRPSELLGWNLSQIICSPSGAKPGRSTGTDFLPSTTLLGEPVLSFHWQLAADKNPAFWRREAEENLSHWDVGIVLDTKAFSLTPLKAATTTLKMDEIPKEAAFRKQVDLVFAAVATNLKHSENAGLWLVRFKTPLSLEQLAQRTVQVPGFQIISVSKSGNSDKKQPWSVEAKLARIISLPITPRSSSSSGTGNFK